MGYQELYEVSLHNNWETAKVVEMKQLKAEVKRQMALQGDYKVRDWSVVDNTDSWLVNITLLSADVSILQGWYHRADLAKFARQRRAMMQGNADTRGHQLED